MQLGDNIHIIYSCYRNNKYNIDKHRKMNILSLCGKAVLVMKGGYYIMRDNDSVYGIISSDMTKWSEGEIGSILHRMIKKGDTESICALISSMINSNIEIHLLSQQGKDHMKQCILSGNYEFDYHNKNDAIKLIYESI